MSKPFSNCDIDNQQPPSPQSLNSELYTLIYNSPFKYNRQLCYEICTTKLVISECNCSNSDVFSFFPKYEPCSFNKEKLKCLRNFKTTLHSNEFIRFKCNCPLECNRTTYRTTMSYSSLVGQYYLQRIKNNWNLSEDLLSLPTAAAAAESVRQSIVRVTIFYESLSYTETNENPSNLSMLFFLGTVGGIVSLFLGINVLSSLELLEAIIDIYFICKKNKK